MRVRSGLARQRWPCVNRVDGRQTTRRGCAVRGVRQAGERRKGGVPVTDVHDDVAGGAADGCRHEAAGDERSGAHAALELGVLAATKRVVARGRLHQLDRAAIVRREHEQRALIHVCIVQLLDDEAEGVVEEADLAHREGGADGKGMGGEVGGIEAWGTHGREGGGEWVAVRVGRGESGPSMSRWLGMGTAVEVARLASGPYTRGRSPVASVPCTRPRPSPT